MEVTETSNGIRIDIPLPPSLNSEMTAFAEKLQDFKPALVFTNRGKNDIKYSYDQQRHGLRVEIPRNRVPTDRSLFSVGTDIDMCRRYIHKVFQDVARQLISDGGTAPFANVRLTNYSLLAFDLCIPMEEYNNREIYFRYSIMEFWLGVPSTEKSEQFSECNIAFSYTPDEFYNTPVILALSEVALHSRLDLIQQLRRYFCMCLTLSDLHFYQRLIDRSLYPEWHIKLFMHFSVKIFAGCTLMPMSRRMVSGKAVEYTQKVIMEDGETETIIVFQREDGVRLRIFEMNEYRRAEGYKEIVDNIVEQYPQLKGVLVQDLTPRDKEREKDSRLYPRLQIMIKNRQLFEAALLAVYKYLYYRLERYSLSKKYQAYHFKEVKNCIKLNHNNYEVAIGFNDERNEFNLQSIISMSANKIDSEIAVNFRRLFSEYISAHFQLSSMVQLIEYFYKRREQSMLYHFCDAYKNYEELMSSQLEQRKKDNFNKLIDLLVRKVQNYTRPHRAYRYFRIERFREGDQLYYDLTIKPYEIRCLLREKGGVIRIRTNLEDVWVLRDTDRKRVIPPGEKRRIEELKEFGKDIKIDEFVV